MSFLDDYKRQPKLYIDLPSSGKFYDQTIIEGGQYVQLPVFSMSAADEIMTKTPDALFSGQAVVSVIQSCIPIIKDPWKLIKVDIEYILSAIRIASFGSTTDIKSTCPSCRGTNTVEVKLQEHLDFYDSIDVETKFQYKDLTINIRPITFKQMTDVGVRIYQQQKMLYQIQMSNDLEYNEKIEKANEAANNVKDISTRALINYIYSISKDDLEEVNTDKINEFIQENDTELASFFVEQITNYVNSITLPAYNIQCGEETSDDTPCLHEYSTTFNSDYTSFFVR